MLFPLYVSEKDVAASSKQITMKNMLCWLSDRKIKNGLPGGRYKVETLQG